MTILRTRPLWGPIVNKYQNRQIWRNLTEFDLKSTLGRVKDESINNLNVKLLNLWFSL